MTLYNAEITKDIIEKDKAYVESFATNRLSRIKSNLEKAIANTDSIEEVKELTKKFNEEIDEAVEQIYPERHKCLVEQLYIFLTNYVNARLIYESQATKEDFIQDTILFLLDRFNKLSEEEKETINLERFFYNRAHSFIGERLRRRSTERHNIKTLKEDVFYLEAIKKSAKQPELIDDYLLDKLVDNYKLPKDKTKALKALAINKLIKLGYFGKYTKFEKDYPETLDKLSFSIIDEYLLMSVKERAGV